MKNLKITDITVYPIIDKTHFVEDSTMLIAGFAKIVLDVQTNEGIHGVGLGYINFDAATTIQAFKATESVVVGKNPLENEAIFNDLFWKFRGARKGFAFNVISALDIALWDIKGKVAGMPVYQLLGGRERKIPIYASGGWTSYTTRELVDEAVTAVKAGYKNIKMKVGYDCGHSPKEDIKRVAIVREAVGDNIGIMIDANNVWNAGTAARFIQEVEQYDLIWFEEPTIADDYEGLAYVRSKCNVPVATGEHEFTRYGARDLVSTHAMDIFQPDICRCGGFTELLKMNAVAQAWNLQLAPHCVDLVHAHFLSAASNGMMLERLVVEDFLLSKIFPNSKPPKDGFLEISDLPGLGLEPDWELLKSTSVLE
jgi:D-arabinonate dehydratase